MPSSKRDAIHPQDTIHPADPASTAESSKPAPFHPTDPAQAAAMNAYITFLVEMVMKYGEGITRKKTKEPIV